MRNLLNIFKRGLSYRQNTCAAWDSLDDSWFDGKLFRYKDPASYPHRDLSELANLKDDVIWLERPAQTTQKLSHFLSFHDRNATPICEQLIAAMPTITPAVYIMGRSDVVLSGYRAFIGRDTFYNLDEIFTDDNITGIETARLGHPEIYRNEMIGFKDTETPGTFHINIANRKFVNISQTVVCISSNEAPNYGSFLFRIFPKLVHLSKLDPQLKVLVPVYFDSLIPFLKLAGISEERIIPQHLDHIYHLKRVLVPSMRNRNLWLDEDTLRFYDQLRTTHGESRTSRRIYITRRSFQTSIQTGRVMLNEADVIAELEQRGFEIVEPEKLSALEQIQLFSSAGVIVAAGGSALFNTVFCHPGTKLIDIEAEPHWVRGHAKLFISRGLDFGFFEGTPVNHDFSKFHIPFNVDLPRLRHRLDTFLDN